MGGRRKVVMLPIRFEEITAQDVLQLIELKTAERKTLEYKERLATGNREERTEFLSDVSSFANASGGDILYGIAEERDETGKATGAPGAVRLLQIDNAAVECARLEQMIESGIQPRLPIVQVKGLELPGTGIVIVVRVGKSWIAPHMVTYSNFSRFFARNSSTGKVQLDVQQIGAAFALQRGLGERLRAWKADRIAKAIAAEGPIPLLGSKLLFHFVSAALLNEELLGTPRSYAAQTWGSDANLMTYGAEIRRYNADGYLLASGQHSDGKSSYLQIFREGALEYGDGYALDSYGKAAVPSRVFEEKLARTFEWAISLLKRLDISDPIFVAVTLIGMKGRTMALPQDAARFSYESEPFDRDVISTPDVSLEPEALVSSLLPLINYVWQAAGQERTPYLDQDQQWMFA